jgi:hypothetical protein
LLAYSRLRAICKEEIRFELDAIDARVVFNSSTGIGLLIIASFFILQPLLMIESYLKPLIPSNLSVPRTIISILIILISVILILSSYLEVQKVRIPLVCQLLKEYNIDQPQSVRNMIKKRRKIKKIKVNVAAIIFAQIIL